MQAFEFLITVFIFAIAMLLFLGLVLIVIHSYKETERMRKMVEDTNYWKDIQDAFSLSEKKEGNYYEDEK